jgi:nitroreductase
MSELVEYLKTRRSDLAMTLVNPAPDEQDIETMITIASRVPDHGKLAPWRFVEYRYDDRQILAKTLIGMSDQDSDIDRKQSREKEISRFQSAPLVIGAISCAQAHPKVPEWEQVLSAGAATMQLLIAANGLGYGSQWLTGWYTNNKNALKLLGVGDNEQVAGMVHIGTPSVEKTERTRPEIDNIFSRYSPSK